MRQTISKYIKGIPFCQNKVKGRKENAIDWTNTIISQTKILPKVHGACNLRVTFFLPPSKFPTDHPFGPDIDNLLKRLCDALQKTILCEAPGGDGAIVNLDATKIRVESNDKAGVHLEIFEFIS